METLTTKTEILTAKQEIFLQAVGNGQNVFLTGKAGTGKSFIVRRAIEKLQQAGRKVIAVAPTGIAANNIDGQTIHSMFKLPPFGVLSFDVCNFIRKGAREVLQKADTVVIDEVSMLRPDVLDGMNWTLRKNGLKGLVAFHSAVKAREQWYGREVLGQKPFPPGGVFPSGTANERKAQALREISKTPYAGALGRNAPKIEPGLKFMARYMDGAIITVLSANETTNLLSVDIENTQGHKWNEDGWNLEHTKWGFERGEYWEVDKHTVIVKAEGDGTFQTGEGRIITAKRDTGEETAFEKAIRESIEGKKAAE